jgi:hypothetical protein
MFEIHVIENKWWWWWSKNSLTNTQILYFLRISSQETLIWIPVITLMIFFWMQNPVFHFLKFSHKITAYDIMEWK